MQRVGEEIVEEFGVIFPVQRGDFRQRQQELAVVGQPGGDLKGEGADDLLRVFVARLLPVAELDGT